MDLTQTQIAAVATMKSMIVATSAVVRSSLTDEQLERRRALLEAHAGHVRGITE